MGQNIRVVGLEIPPQRFDDVTMVVFDGPARTLVDTFHSRSAATE